MNLLLHVLADILMSYMYLLQPNIKIKSVYERIKYGILKWETFFYISYYAMKRIICTNCCFFKHLIQFVFNIKYGKTSSKYLDEEWCPSPFEEKYKIVVSKHDPESECKNLNFLTYLFSFNATIVPFQINVIHLWPSHAQQFISLSY